METNGLRRLRLARGLTAAQLAQAAGATEAEVLRWEAGELPPSDRLLALSAALGVEVEEILRAAQEPSAADEQNHAAGEQASAADEQNLAAGEQAPVADGQSSAADEQNPAAGERAPIPASTPVRERVKERLSSPANGFTHVERIFGYIVCLLIAAAAIFLLVKELDPQQRSLNMDNYGRYLTLSAQSGTNSAALEVTSDEDIENFTIVIEVEFISAASFEDRMTSTVSLADDRLEEGEALRGKAEVWTGMYSFFGYHVASVGGNIV